MLVGDLSQMGQLAARLRDLAEVPSRVARRVSAELGALIEDEFDAGADPYGRAWKELAPATLAKGRHDPPLTDTSQMRAGVRVAPLQRAGVAITIPHPGGPHQTGWSGPQGDGPARPILPTGVMPALWREAIQVATEAEVRP